MTNKQVITITPTKPTQLALLLVYRYGYTASLRDYNSYKHCRMQFSINKVNCMLAILQSKLRKVVSYVILGEIDVGDVPEKFRPA